MCVLRDKIWKIWNTYIYSLYVLLNTIYLFRDFTRWRPQLSRWHICVPYVYCRIQHMCSVTLLDEDLNCRDDWYVFRVCIAEYNICILWLYQMKTSVVEMTYMCSVCVLRNTTYVFCDFTRWRPQLSRWLICIPYVYYKIQLTYSVTLSDEDLSCRNDIYVFHTDITKYNICIPRLYQMQTSVVEMSYMCSVCVLRNTM